jgi:hypothetical protein
VLTTYREPRVFGTSAEVVVTGIIEQDIRSSFNFSRRVIQAQVGRSLSPLYTATGAYSFQRTRLFDIRASADDEAWLIDRLFPQVGCRSSRARCCETAATRRNCSIPRTGVR